MKYSVLLLACICFACIINFSSCLDRNAQREAFRLLDRHPYMVSIRNYGRFDCGGTLIGPQTVITAAQCVDTRYGRSELPELWLNATETENFIEGGTLLRQTTEVRFHPNYTGDVFDGYDYAILFISEPVELTPIRTANSVTLNQIGVGSEVSLLGFGRATRTSGRVPYLQYTESNLVSPEACKNSPELVYLEDQMMCIEGDTPCSGDQGGPVFNSGEIATADTLIGIISYTVCDLNSRLAVVASTMDLHIFPWIISTRNELEGEDPDEENSPQSYLDQYAELAQDSTVAVEDIFRFLLRLDE